MPVVEPVAVHTATSRRESSSASYTRRQSHRGSIPSTSGGSIMACHVFQKRSPRARGGSGMLNRLVEAIERLVARMFSDNNLGNNGHCGELSDGEAATFGESLGKNYHVYGCGNPATWGIRGYLRLDAYARLGICIDEEGGKTPRWLQFATKLAREHISLGCGLSVATRVISWGYCRWEVEFTIDLVPRTYFKVSNSSGELKELKEAILRFVR
ncbi:hypothetical protein FNV43_RR08854 [Rhamnella rubrinervis]|uniref:Uncharacterized protein n=1 Tax=Rhamnella rubrinervis TaxID=2594499 RepID=A0A8K0H9P1_9ROSA|nr:hypothetical protein FNV43_RR08854 [Rhamnella rubrinervis]